MSPTTEDEQYACIIRKIDPRARLLRATPLAGGISARVAALDIERPGGQPQTLIVRRHGALDLGRNPNLARDEYRLLQFLQSQGVPAPVPYLTDATGDICETPYIVVSYLDGKPEFAPADLPSLLAQMAALMARLHQVDGAHPDLSFMPRQAQFIADRLRERPVTLDDSMAEGRIRDALESVWPLAARNRSVLLHGDIWPGNLLWQDGRLTGIIDWEDAAIGDPLADLGNTRLEILWAYGPDAMHEFTRAYLANNPIDTTHLPYWDLCAALKPCGRLSEWASGDATLEQQMRTRHHAFVTQAFARLDTNH